MEVRATTRIQEDQAAMAVVALPERATTAMAARAPVRGATAVAVPRIMGAVAQAVKAVDLMTTPTRAVRAGTAVAQETIRTLALERPQAGTAGGRREVMETHQDLEATGNLVSCTLTRAIQEE